MIGCAVLLLMVGCAGTRSEAPPEDQEHSPEATASEEARCEGTRTFHLYVVLYPNGMPTNGGRPRSGSEEDMRKDDKKARHNGNKKVDDLGVYTTNDLPGCPKGGLLKGTDKPDLLSAKHGDDEVRGLGGSDYLDGGPGNDILYAGDGNDGFLSGGEGDDVIHAGDGNEDFLSGDKGEDVIYGGDGNDILDGQSGEDGQRDKLYCGKGKDSYLADKNDYVDSSCEKKQPSNYFYA